MKDMKNQVQAKELNLYDVYDEYDKDKSYLLGLQEIVLFCKNMKIPVNQAETQVLDAGLRKLYGRSEIKKAEFAKIIN